MTDGSECSSMNYASQPEFGKLPDENLDVENGFYEIPIDESDTQVEQECFSSPEYLAGKLKSMLENGSVEDKETYFTVTDVLYEMWCKHGDGSDDYDPFRFHLDQAMNMRGKFEEGQ